MRYLDFFEEYEHYWVGSSGKLAAGARNSSIDSDFMILAFAMASDLMSKKLGADQQIFSCLHVVQMTMKVIRYWVTGKL